LKKREVTLKDIAKKAGVSVGTAHRAIYGKKGVGEETRRKILRIVEDSNYKIDEVASILKRGNVRIAVVLPAAANEDKYYFRGIWEGVKTAAKNMERYKMHFEFIEAEYSLDNIAQALKELYDTPDLDIQGLITISDSSGAGEWVSRFSRRGIPVVLISSYEEGVHCLASVKADHRICSRLAADFFSFALRPRKGKILVLTGHSDIYSNRIYAQSFEKYVKENYPCFELIQVEGFGKKKLADTCGEIITREKLCGIFTCNARNTYFMCELLKDLPKKKDLLFVGTDVFDELGPYFESGLIAASVYQSHREQGIEAVNMMHQYLSGTSASYGSRLLPVLLILKGNYHFFSS
jgi:DNA-binding LacI/PurR family transcriptional regulator